MSLKPKDAGGGHIRKLSVPHVSNPGEKADARTI
jgi:hypothetical protein